MREKLLHTPEGVRDIYNSECTKKKKMEERLHHVMKTFGFTDIETPTFEFFDVFGKERGTVPSKDMYKFFDREGNTLVLRPDMTPSIARCAAKYYKDVNSQLRLCYKGNTFINNSEYQGKLKESTQIGAELINDSSVQADAEMIALAVSALKESGLERFTVEVGHTGFFRALVSEADFSDDDIVMLKVLIENKNLFGIESFLKERGADEELIAVLSSLPQLFGNVDSLPKIRTLTSNSEALEAIDRLEKLYSLMKIYGIEDYISFDLGTLSRYEYYTGIIFNAYTYGTGDAVLSGGRYDGLVATFGKDAPAIGLAIYVDRLMMALSRQKLDLLPAADKTVLVYPESVDISALAYVCRMRNQGRYVVAMSVPEGSDVRKAALEVKDEAVMEVLVMLDNEEVYRV